MGASALIAIGGNSLIRAGEKGTVAEQLANARRTARPIVELLARGWKIVLTHGNGPQVGAALLRSERASDQVYGQPLDVCDATTQGEIGYFLQQALLNELKAASLEIPVATVLTQVLVSHEDPSMRRPTKPVGPFYSRADAEERKLLLGWNIVEDAARGWRRIVPSPEPLAIIEEAVLRTMMDAGALVIAAGGGGIPVVREGEELRGVEAVIDKDRVSALLASRLDADLLIISTETPCAYLDYRKATQRPIERITAAALEVHLREGQFPPGNMGPKVESAIQFLRAGGREAVITCCDQLIAAVSGSAGTHVVP